jgi:hypothetical protein
MQRFETVLDVAASPDKVWGLLHSPPPPGAPSPRTVKYPGGWMKILLEGDEHGQGMVRTCEFGVPRYLGSKGRARSWEIVTEVRPGEYASYQGIGKPLWSRASGSHELTPLPDGGTRLTFIETYHVVNPLLRRLLEKRVHRYISHDNHALYLKILGYLGTVTTVSQRSTTVTNPAQSAR